MSLGVDVVDIKRIEEIRDRQAFMAKVLTEREILSLAEVGGRIDRVAGLFASKEAIMKLLGLGLADLSFKEIEILHEEKGRPIVQLYGKAKEEAQALGIAAVDLTISHDGGIAVAIARGLDLKEAEQADLLPMLHFLPELNQSILKRDKRGYKSQYGKVALIGGSSGMAGSISMAAQAALRSGAGLVYALVPRSIAESVQGKVTEVIVKAIEDEGMGYFSCQHFDEVKEAVQACDCLALGPGLGRNPATIDFVQSFIRTLDKPAILDADALYAVAQRPTVLRETDQLLILTPHEMEMSRMCGDSLAEIGRNRSHIADRFAEENGVILVLKGADTVISNGRLHYINPTGNPGMATAGSGDVLTGMMAGLLAYGYKPLIAVRLACYLHGLAGDLASLAYGQNSMIATDMIEEIPGVFRIIEHENRKLKGDGVYGEN